MIENVDTTMVNESGYYNNDADFDPWKLFKYSCNVIVKNIKQLVTDSRRGRAGIYYNWSCLTSFRPSMSAVNVLQNPAIQDKALNITERHQVQKKQPPSSFRQVSQTIPMAFIAFIHKSVQ
ncbi:hypothetical protein TNCT_422501 [Trichonephila clavata]|uniref:Uncharacterized protein n=1 Tax=Trichonephila clavata TaxID=2740835 RepID=A0A8X6FEX8_TRICU|nr:hypothetical protein TNCT_422501 [Trichonephila clavata]